MKQDYKIPKMLEINQETLKLYSYQEIRDTLLERFKDTYNLEEIPVNSADYVMANNISLVIWNLLNEVRNVYQQHNIDSATDNYLDKIMALYGKFRHRAKPYIFQIEVEGEGHNLVKDTTEIKGTYTEKKDDVPQVIEEFNFKLLQQLDTNVNSSVYLVRSDQYYEDLTVVKLDKLEFSFKNLLDVKKKQDSHLVLKLIQRKSESDLDFRVRAYNNLTNDDITSTIKNLPFVDDVQIIAPNSTIKGLEFLTESSLSTGEIVFIVRFNDIYYSSNNKENNNSEIEINLSNLLPIGFITKPLTDLKSGILEEKDIITKVSPLTSIVYQKLVWNIIPKIYGAVGFTAMNVSSDDIETLAQDMLSRFQNRNLYYFEYESLLKDIQVLFNIKENKIWYSSKIDKVKEFKEVNWVTSSDNIFKFDGTTPIKIKDSQNLDTGFVSTYNTLTHGYFKWEITKYEYKLNIDGSYTIVFY